MTNYRQWLLDEIDRLNVLNDEIGYLLVSESSRIEVLQEALTKYDQSGIEDLVEVSRKLQHLNQCELEGLSSGMPSPKQWKDGTHDWYSMEQFVPWQLEVIGSIHGGSDE